MKIHYLQHVPFEGLGSIEPWARQHQHTLSVTRLYQNDPWPLLEDFDWLIVMGGPMNIYEESQYPWLIEEKQFIKQAIAQNKTVIGICLGSQLIADILGSPVYSGKYKEIGWFPIELTTDAINSELFKTFSPQLTVFHWHGDTFDLPPGATRLAYSEACQNQAFLYGNKVLGLQFHLESTPASVTQMLKHCSDELVEGKYIQTSADLLASDQYFMTINNVMNTILERLAQQSCSQKIEEN